MSTPVPAARTVPISSEQMAQHEGLVHWVVRQQWLGDLPFEDALHEGRLGLWAALQHYDPQRGTAFSTYAVPAIARAVWRAVALQQRTISPVHKVRCSLSQLDEAIDLDEVIDNAQVRSLLVDLVEGLPPRLRQVVIAHHGLDDSPPQTFAAIGQALGISRQRAHQLHNTAILWLAHPAHSLPLRRVLGRHSRADYRQTLARQRRATRSRRWPPSALSLGLNRSPSSATRRTAGGQPR